MNSYGLVRFMNEEYIRGVGLIHTPKSAHFSLEHTFPILSGSGEDLVTSFSSQEKNLRSKKFKPGYFFSLLRSKKFKPGYLSSLISGEKNLRGKKFLSGEKKSLSLFSGKKFKPLRDYKCYHQITSNSGFRN